MSKHCNQYKCKHGKDVGAYMIGFLYIMIVMVGLYDYSLISAPQVDASEEKNSDTPIAVPAKPQQVEDIKVSTPAGVLEPITREDKLRVYLEEKNSPLAPYADYIVEVSDEYDISWTLIVSIAGKESSFGKHIKANSFNAWGVMQWSKEGKRSIRSFNSWKEGILFEAKLLSNHYREDMNKAIQTRYCPSFECSDTWVANVTGFQKEINN